MSQTFNWLQHRQKSKIKETLIKIFATGLDPSLGQMVLSVKDIPTMLNEWIRQASKFHTQQKWIAALWEGDSILPPEIVAPVFVSDPGEKSICICISIFVNEGAQIIDIFVLVDSGATSDFNDQDLIKKKRISTAKTLSTTQSTKCGWKCQSRRNNFPQSNSLSLNHQNQRKKEIPSCQLWSREPNLGTTLTLRN